MSKTALKYRKFEKLTRDTFDAELNLEHFVLYDSSPKSQ